MGVSFVVGVSHLCYIPPFLAPIFDRSQFKKLTSILLIAVVLSTVDCEFMRICGFRVLIWLFVLEIQV